MTPVNFIFALHFHQPTGQLEHINKRIMENSYKLLLEIFKEYSSFKFTVHISGPLLNYMMDYYPDYLNELLKLHDYGTIEFMAGSIGEAILPILPMEDRIEQLKIYLDVFEKLAGFRPKGLWLPERVWEPSLPYVTAVNNIEYVLIDDSTLVKTGLSSNYSNYAWLTEEGGFPLKVFFIDAGLRNILPWEDPKKVLEYMRSKMGDEPRVLLWGSDAEKFGEWMDPGWSREWLTRFLEALRSNSDIIRMVQPSEYLDSYGVKGLLYLNSGSYDKMLEWSGGFFRNFLIKYKESNNMHKKILYVKKKMRNAILSRDITLKYYLAQCNDAFWHGLFGGIYLSHLRQAIYENLIYVEREIERVSNYFEKDDSIYKLYDFDYDGRKELLIETPLQNLYVKPDDGGVLFEYDVKVMGLEHNLQDTMSRYPEPYLNIPWFNPDWYRRVSWRVHLWSHDTGIYEWINNSPFKDMSDLALSRSYVSLSQDDPREVILRSIGGYYVLGGLSSKLLLEKRVRLDRLGHKVSYKIVNMGPGDVKARLGLEYHVSPKIDRKGMQKPVYFIKGEERDIMQSFIGRGNSISLKSPIYSPIILKTSRDVDLWVSPLNMYARTEKGVMETNQGLAIMFSEVIELKKDEEYSLDIEWNIGD
ncbi:MAG: alpha-amylase/4-alpha-glucanotransferase domain-containing protein [Thermosphaera sp.]